MEHIIIVFITIQLLKKCNDFRIAVIFEIAKMKYKLENELEP